MADNWWDAQSEQAAAKAFGSSTFTPSFASNTKAYYDALRPDKSKLDEYRKATGSGFVDSRDYQNWTSIDNRFKTLGRNVDRMASGDPTTQANSERFQSDLSRYGGRLDSYLDTAAPVASQDNQFAAGLTDAESRLRALLDNPDSVQQSAAYKFRVGQGQEALQRSLGAKGLLNSGNRLMELTKYGQDMGSQEYDAQAGRLGNLLGNYSQSWIGDKNANTQRYLAESQAWNQRGGVLSDLYKNATTAANQNQQIGSDNRVKWASALSGLLPAAPTTIGNTTFWNMVK